MRIGKLFYWKGDIEYVARQKRMIVGLWGWAYVRMIDDDSIESDAATWLHPIRFIKALRKFLTR